MEPKSVLITGANRGLGLEFVKQFLKLKKPPVHIFAGCRDPDKAEELQKIARESSAVKIVKIDVSNLETIKSAEAEVNKILGDDGLNLLINNAGISTYTPFADSTVEKMMEIFRVNVGGSFVMSQTFLPLLKRAAEKSKLEGLSCSKAAIVNVSSSMGSLSETGKGGYLAQVAFPYKVSKAALNMTSQVLASNFKKDGIFAMSVCPGWVKTDMGGSNAQLSPEQSISGVMKVMSEATEANTGTFRLYNGNPLEW